MKSNKEMTNWEEDLKKRLKNLELEPYYNFIVNEIRSHLKNQREDDLIKIIDGLTKFTAEPIGDIEGDLCDWNKPSVFANNYSPAELQEKVVKRIKDIFVILNSEILNETTIKLSNKEHIGECRMCFKDNVELYHFDLYVTGSEGIWICSDCRMLITKYVRNIKTENLHKKLKEKKDIRTQNRENGYYFSGRECPECGSKDTDTKAGAPYKTWFCYKCNKIVLTQGY